MHPAPSPAGSELLHTRAQRPGRERVSVRDLIDALGDRALGALLFLLAVPNVPSAATWKACIRSPT